MRINRFTPERGATQPQQHCGSRGRDASVGCRYDCIGLSERRRDLSALLLPPSLSAVVFSLPGRLISRVVD